MKKYSILVLCALVLLMIVLSPASSQTASLNLNITGVDNQPKSVPGSINHGNGAVVKTGYVFVRRGDEVDVVRVIERFTTGTYACRCSSNPNKKCELLFQPKQIFCRQGSCSGSCQLVTVEPAAVQ